jgi:hypothetical protein
VTLGGSNPTNGVGGKRHPTLLDNVIVGSGAQIIGPVQRHPVSLPLVQPDSGHSQPLGDSGNTPVVDRPIRLEAEQPVELGDPRQT